MTSPTDQPMAKAYEPQTTEDRVYQFWETRGYFKGRIPEPGTPAAAREPFCIIMPPPNVTGELHIGHALTDTVEDILIRWHRMLGDPTLWVPGVDHAGIATQNVVEKQLAKEGMTRHDLGRDEFEKRVWQWVGALPPDHQQPAPPPRRIGRLVERSLHARRHAAARRAHDVQEDVRRRADLSRRAADQLVPALPHRAQRPGGRARGAAGQPLVHPLPRRRWHERRRLAAPDRRAHHRRDDAAGDVRRRHGGRGEPEGRALHDRGSAAP